MKATSTVVWGYASLFFNSLAAWMASSQGEVMQTCICSGTTLITAVVMLIMMRWQS